MAESAQPSWSRALFGATLEKTGSSEVQFIREVFSDKNKLDFLKREFKPLCLNHCAV